MIQNDQQLANTKEWIARFREAIERNETEPLRHPDPRMRTIMHEALASQLDDLKAQVHAYEAGTPVSASSAPVADVGAIQNDESAEGLMQRVVLLELQLLQVQQELADLRALVLATAWQAPGTDACDTSAQES